MSLKTPTVRPVSSKIREGVLAFCNFTRQSSQHLTKVFNSLSSSATRFIFCNSTHDYSKILWLNTLYQLFQTRFFLVRLLFSEKSRPYRKKAATPENDLQKEISAVNRGPLDEIGSLDICTKISCPTLSVSLTVPSLSISGNMLNLEIDKTRLRSESDCLINFSHELN